MNIDDILGPSVSLGDVLRDPSLLPEWAWLYTQERGSISFSTMCRATNVDSQQLSEEDCDTRDSALRDGRYRCILCRSQIEDVITNLRHRHSEPTRAQIEEAVQYYLDHDA